jgi:predicted phosphodiesterase
VADVLAVRGNVDGGPLGDLPLEVVAAWAGTTVAVRHICGRPDRPAQAATDLIARVGAGVLVFGHSHVPLAARQGDCIWLNPGAAGHEGFHQERTAALLALSEDAAPRVMRIRLGRRGRSQARDPA